MALVPKTVVTRRLTVPGVPGGATAVICVPLLTVKCDAAFVPNFTAVTRVKPLPVTMTVVPPVEGPDEGRIKRVAEELKNVLREEIG